ncbi:hypothetical protein [Pseudoalteromonas piscicida]|uniref:Uncharacterized protein n=1 Tax=Pseudoalteromonas piscicida TaxID=43662 RepID=A0AAD0RLJ9_PSEO7|nr:hypothetical protein [Pseudoalteromonas piscicida]ASD69401.1 hypothetical protein B1L02_21155 [Pseudoalteromonas piscicida]AXR00004.1 hypothetical protein D0N37_20680 [Pseudoalteromonas piscicida]AXR04239.1 hypothetical protein D0511_20130 [Pseudoalteromonas piscicida]
MIYKTTGWAAVLLSLVAFYPSMQPGAFSVIGFYLCLFSLIIAAFASHMDKPIYFRSVITLSLVNILLVNDGTRASLWFGQSDWVYIGSMYGIFLVVVSICGFLVSRNLLISTLEGKIE